MKDHPYFVIKRIPPDQIISVEPKYTWSYHSTNGRTFVTSTTQYNSITSCKYAIWNFCRNIIRTMNVGISEKSQTIIIER